MNILALDFENYYLDFIEAYTEVYGEEYRDVIEERVNNTYNIFYIDLQGVERYYNFLKVKRIHLSAFQFLKSIGVDVTKLEKEEYTSHNLDALLKDYIGGIQYFDEDRPTSNHPGILAFETEDTSDRIIEEQIEFINFIRPDSNVTLENYHEFQNSEEYTSILSLIHHYLEIYHRVIQEEANYFKEIQKYKDYYQAENGRKLKIASGYILKLYNEIKEKLPLCVQDTLDKMYLSEEEKANAIIGDLFSQSDIEYFSRKLDIDSKDEMSLPPVKYITYNFFKLQFLKSIGIPVEEVENDIPKYQSFLSREDIRKYFPSYELVEEISSKKKKYAEEVTKEFICSSSSYLENLELFGDSPGNKEYIYRAIKERKISEIGAFDSNSAFAIISFTIRGGMEGAIDYIYLHELAHAIEQCAFLEEGIVYGGFELTSEKNPPSNPYNPKKRKYEVLNETFTDIFSIEARNILHKKGIYFGDSKEHIITNVENRNTDGLLKEIVRPLLSKARSHVVKARLMGKVNELCDFIGYENFEQLNDIVNMVSYLITQGLKKKLESSLNTDPLVVEYRKQMVRLQEVYAAIDAKIVENTPKHY